MDVIYIDNDNLLAVDSLKNSSTGVYLNSAAVTVTLKDSSGVNISGQTFPLTMDYEASSDGKYTATLDDALVLDEGNIYTAIIDAVSDSGITAKWNFQILAVKRI